MSTTAPVAPAAAKNNGKPGPPPAPPETAAQRHDAKFNALAAAALEAEKPATVPAPPAAGHTRLVPIHLVDESPTNPRQKWDQAALEDLAASIRAQGLLQPILIRQHPTNPDRFQLVCGARRLRASVLAGLGLVPAVERELTDRQVAEAQLVENEQREDVSALEQGLAYGALREQGATIEEIAQRIGKSASHVYQRLKMTELTSGAKEAFNTGLLTASHAVLIARLQPADQQRAIEANVEESWHGRAEPVKEAVSVRELAAWIRDECERDLKQAPFNREDSSLLAGAGACSGCPKNRANEPGATAKSGQICLDPECYSRKERNHQEAQRAAVAAKAGCPPKHVALVSHSYSGAPKGVLDSKGWKAAAEKSCKHVRPAIAVDAKGPEALIHVCTERECRKHWPSPYSSSSSPEDQKKAAEKRETVKAQRLALAQAVLGKVTTELGAADLRLVLESCNRLMDEDALKVLGWLAADKAHAWDAPRKTLESRLPKANLVELHRCLLAAALGDTLELWQDKAPKLEALARHWRVDPDKVYARVVDERRQAAAAAEIAVAAKANDPRSAFTPGKCRKCGCTDLAACPGGCSWVEPDLCSRCAPPATKKAGKPGKTAAKPAALQTSAKSGSKKQGAGSGKKAKAKKVRR